MIIPVILCGGVGSRLWPLSRKTNPKQFISIISNNITLFDQTLQRIKGDIFDEPIIVCNEEYEFKIREALHKQNVKPKIIILEPDGRNTAPAIALAAFYAEQNNLEGSFLVLPADHYIEEQEKFIEDISKANKFAKDHLITFGIRPTSPSTAYGYIRKSAQYNQEQGIYQVAEFVEKPDYHTAVSYLNSQEYYWNSGIFLFKPEFYLKELKKFAPKIYSHTSEAINNSVYINELCKPDTAEFLSNTNTSIDYAILEKSKNVLVYPVEITWSDVGSWESIYKISHQDINKNSFIGDVVAIDAQNNFAYSTEKLTTLVNVKNLVVVSTKDAVLVADKSQTEKVKDLVDKLKNFQRKEYSDHLKIYRPWGWFEDINQGSNYRVKRIVVNPRGKLSLQLHNHRSEHWVIIRGQALVTVDELKLTLSQGESTFIPPKTKHRLENETNDPLEIIEVQIGEYLEEDDIIRFEDMYGRSK